MTATPSAAGGGEPGVQPPLQRWRLDISYDGTGFSGWASQPDRRTVQGELEHWLQQVLRLTSPVSLVCAGRTDAGVHARGQVAHVDLPVGAVVDGDALVRRLGRIVPPDVVVRAASRAPEHFDARFGAVWRRYSYRLMDAGAGVDPLMRHHVTRIKEPVDLAALNAAAATLLGLRDFGAFCRRRLGATTIRTLLELSGRRVDSGPLAGSIDVTVRADAFCHSMVRSLIGALVAVGSGRRSLGWLAEVTNGAVRDSSVEVMPPHGLTLEEVRYPADDQLRERAAQARSSREVPAGV
jgi:tRNA pseudouridine38-40 synthase